MNGGREALVAEAIAHLRALVAFDSVSSHSNLPIIAHIHSILTQHGIDSDVLPSPDGKKANLLARIGPLKKGGVVLSGHTDVVPVEGQQWDSDPFTLTEKDGKLFGRGTSDMKTFIAVCLTFAPLFKKLKLAKPIYFCFSYDEEVGCLGVPHMLKHLAGLPAPAYAIIGEPTMMQVVTAHKGVLSFETTVHGLEWHSSQPHYGVNAVHIACDLVHFLSSMAQELSESGKQDPRFDPSFSTVHVGVIHGGTARNIIPKECRFNWEIRPLPGEQADRIYARFEAHCQQKMVMLRARHPDAGIVTRPISHMTAVTLPVHAAESCRQVMHCARSNRELAVSFGTEAGVFNEHGIPAIICGPGNIEQAHKPNEFIATSQIGECVEFMSRLMEEWTANGA
jgi:acetylornithine deacetylase